MARTLYHALAWERKKEATILGLLEQFAAGLAERERETRRDCVKLAEQSETTSAARARNDRD